MIKVTDYIAKRLKEHGVDHFFMVSGGGAMHLNDSLGSAIPYTANHHEQACAIAAEGYARVNQRLGVVNVTTGPGGLNCLNGVFGQWTDSVPVLYLSGQVKYSTSLACCPDIPLRQLGDQEVDIISVVKPLIKYAEMVTEPNDIKYHLDKAIYEATSGRFGPVWLDIPMNVQGALINEDELREFVSSPPDCDCVDWEALSTQLEAARRPLIVAGHGIRIAGQNDKFLQFAEANQIPVVTTFNGFDVISDEHPLYVGRIGTIGQRAGNFVLQNADLILTLGTRNNIRQVSYNWENYAKNAYKIFVDVDKAELSKPTCIADMAICADLKDFMPELLTRSLNVKPNIEWLDYCKEVRQKFAFDSNPDQVSNGAEIEPYHFTRVLSKCLADDDVVVMANGSACVCTFQNAHVQSNQRYVLNSGCASMGYGLPAAIGACYDAGNRRVVCIEGDGSIMMNLQELETMKYNNLPIKLFIINNSGYSSIRQTQRNFFDGRMTGCGVDSGVSVPDFGQLGRAFGLQTAKISNPSTMEQEIKMVLQSDGPILCEVMVEREYGFAPKLSARTLEDGTMVSPTLEDMYPFLDRDSYNAYLI